MKTEHKLLWRVKMYMTGLIVGLALSGITAMPIQAELAFLVQHSAGYNVHMREWLQTVFTAVRDTNKAYPFLSYGTDWLGFAHLILAILFIGPAIDPVKNVWVIEFGIIASVLIFPLALIAGAIRGIPVFWQLIDCSFGVLALIPLLLSYFAVRRLTNTKTLNCT